MRFFILYVYIIWLILKSILGIDDFNNLVPGFIPDMPDTIPEKQASLDDARNSKSDEDPFVFDEGGDLVIVVPEGQLSGGL